jgi:hypothetical protein
MLLRFRRPTRTEMLVFVLDDAFACTVDLKLIQYRGYFFVMPLAHARRLENGPLERLCNPYAEAALVLLLGSDGGDLPPSGSTAPLPNWRA